MELLKKLIRRFEIKFYFLISIVGLLLSSCQLTPPPIEEYILARTALDAARLSQSHRYSPGFWSRAEMAYRLGQSYFKEENYDRARDEFVKARQNAERAENSARLIRAKSGDVL